MDIEPNRQTVNQLVNRLHRTWARSDANEDEFIRALTQLLIERIVFFSVGKPLSESIRLAEITARNIIDGVKD
jgi:hypothetical protein